MPSVTFTFEEVKKLLEKQREICADVYMPDKRINNYPAHSGAYEVFTREKKKIIEAPFPKEFLLFQ
jgi:hypothetical protein